MSFYKSFSTNSIHFLSSRGPGGASIPIETGKPIEPRNFGCPYERIQVWGRVCLCS